MDESEIRNKAKKIILENLVTGYSKSKKTNFTYIKPSKNFYSYQYFWDTCFHIYILCSLEETTLAKECLRTQFAMQEEDGFVGHIHYWDNIWPARVTDIFQNRLEIGRDLLRSHMSSLIQPPLVAQALQKIYKTTGDKDFLREMLPKLKKYYSWLAKNRDFDNDSLLSIITPFESGMDWKPSYDPVVHFKGAKGDWKLFLKVIIIDFKNFLRNYNYEKIKKNDHFRVKDAGFNTIYVQNLQATAMLCEEIQDDDAPQYRSLFKKVKNAILTKMYDEQDAAFYDLYGKESEKLKKRTATIFYPIIIEGMPDDICKKVIDRHFFNKEEFHTKYPIPSVAINEPSFYPKESLYIWRGPTWIVNNWFMHQFLLKKGYKEEAKHLVTAIEKLVGKSGFREYYNPFTGEGYGATNFTWAALVLDMIQMENQ